MLFNRFWYVKNRRKTRFSKWNEIKWNHHFSNEINKRIKTCWPYYINPPSYKVYFCRVVFSLHLESHDLRRGFKTLQTRYDRHSVQSMVVTMTQQQHPYETTACVIDRATNYALLISRSKLHFSNAIFNMASKSMCANVLQGIYMSCA